MLVSFNPINFCSISPKPLSANKVLKTTIIPNTQKGALNEFEMNIVNEIRDLFELAHSTIKSIAKSCNTRNSIKNGYDKLKKGVAGSRILEFSNIGLTGEDISVNLRIDRGKTKKTIIIIGDTQLVINPKGQIEKNPSMRFIRDNSGREKGEVVSYYTQSEIDNLNPKFQFFALRRELAKYVDYIKTRGTQINKIREQKSEKGIGTVEKYSELIDEVLNELNYFKTHINKLSERASDKNCFRIVNKVKTFYAQNSIMLKKVTPDERSLYLVNSIINGKKATKLFVMSYNNKDIDKSFIIYDNKLAKYYPKKPNDKPSHLENDFHYFSQEEIDNSELKYYLTLLKDRLYEVNDNLERGIEERRNKNHKINR